MDDTLGTPRQALRRSEQGLEKPTRRILSVDGRLLEAAATICGKWQLKVEAWFPRATNIMRYCRSGWPWAASASLCDRAWRFRVIELRPTSMLESISGIGGTGSSSVAPPAFLSSFSFLAARLPFDRLTCVCRYCPRGLKRLSLSVWLSRPPTRESALCGGRSEMGTPVIMEHSDLLAQQLKNCVLIFRRDRRPRYPVNHLRPHNWIQKGGNTRRLLKRAYPAGARLSSELVVTWEWSCWRARATVGVGSHLRGKNVRCRSTKLRLTLDSRTR